MFRADDIFTRPDLEYHPLELEQEGGREQHTEDANRQDQLRLTFLLLLVAFVAGSACFGASCLLFSEHDLATFKLSLLGNWATIILVIVGFLWTYRTYRNVPVGRDPGYKQSMFVGIGSTGLGVYMLVQAVWYILFKPYHYAYLIELNMDARRWKAAFGERSFLDAWSGDKTKFLVIVVCAATVGVILLWVSYTVRSYRSVRYYLTRLLLYLSIISCIAASFMIGIWSTEALLFKEELPNRMGRNLPQILRVFGWSAVVICLANTAANFHRKKHMYMVIAILSWVVFVGFASSTFLLIRDVKDAGYSEAYTAGDCRSTMVSIHEDQIRDVCPFGGKYLPEGVNCDPRDEVIHWEDAQTQTSRFLNPACCSMAKFFYYLPLMQLSLYAAVALFSLMMVAALDLELADMNTSRLDMLGRNTVRTDLYSVSCVLILAFAFALVFALRKGSEIKDRFSPHASNYINPVLFPIDKLELVDEGVKVLSELAPADAADCLPYLEEYFPLPRFDSKDSNCSSNCTHRLALLMSNGTLQSSGSVLVARGVQGASSVFFPHCFSNDTRSFTFLVGPLADIREFLRTSKVCLVYRDTMPQIFMFHDQVPARSVDASGLSEGEKASLVTMSRVRQPTDSPCGGSAVEATPTSCQGHCKVQIDLLAAGRPKPLKGQLYYKSTADMLDHTDINTDINVEVYADGGRKLNTTFRLFDDGLFLIENVTASLRFASFITLRVSDPSNRFLNKSVAVQVPPLDRVNRSVSAGRIRLLSPSGIVCAKADAECTKREIGLNGEVVVAVKLHAYPTPVTSSNLSQSLKVLVYCGHVLKSQEPLKVSTRKLTGQELAVEQLEYGSYSIVVWRDGYNSETVFVDLQQPVLAAPEVALQPLVIDNDMRVQAYVDEQSADIDFNVEIRSDQGYSCIVNALNKYCGYGMASSDVVNRTGYEYVYFRKLAIAEYRAFFIVKEPYVQKCPFNLEAPVTPQHFSGIHWEQVGTTRPLSELNVSFSSDSLSRDSAKTRQSRSSSDLVPLNDPVETSQQADKPHRLIGLNGRTLRPEEQVEMKTAFEDNKGPAVTNESTATASLPTVVTNETTTSNSTQPGNKTNQTENTTTQSESTVSQQKPEEPTETAAAEARANAPYISSTEHVGHHDDHNDQPSVLCEHPFSDKDLDFHNIAVLMNHEVYEMEQENHQASTKLKETPPTAFANNETLSLNQDEFGHPVIGIFNFKTADNGSKVLTRFYSRLEDPLTINSTEVSVEDHNRMVYRSKEEAKYNSSTGKDNIVGVVEQRFQLFSNGTKEHTRVVTPLVKNTSESALPGVSSLINLSKNKAGDKYLLWRRCVEDKHKKSGAKECADHQHSSADNITHTSLVIEVVGSKMNLSNQKQQMEQVFANGSVEVMYHTTANTTTNTSNYTDWELDYHITTARDNSSYSQRHRETRSASVKGQEINQTYTLNTTLSQHKNLTSRQGEKRTVGADNRSRIVVSESERLLSMTNGTNSTERSVFKLTGGANSTEWHTQVYTYLNDSSKVNIESNSTNTSVEHLGFYTFLAAGNKRDPVKVDAPAEEGTSAGESADEEPMMHEISHPLRPLNISTNSSEEPKNAHVVLEVEASNRENLTNTTAEEATSKADNEIPDDQVSPYFERQKVEVIYNKTAGRLEETTTSQDDTDIASSKKIFSTLSSRVTLVNGSTPITEESSSNESVNTTLKDGGHSGSQANYNKTLKVDLYGAPTESLYQYSEIHLCDVDQNCTSTSKETSESKTAGRYSKTDSVKDSNKTGGNETIKQILNFNMGSGETKAHSTISSLQTIVEGVQVRVVADYFVEYTVVEQRRTIENSTSVTIRSLNPGEANTTNRNGTVAIFQNKPHGLISTGSFSEDIVAMENGEVRVDRTTKLMEVPTGTPGQANASEITIVEKKISQQANNEAEGSSKIEIRTDKILQITNKTSFTSGKVVLDLTITDSTSSLVDDLVLRESSNAIHYLYLPNNSLMLVHETITAVKSSSKAKTTTITKNVSESLVSGMAPAPVNNIVQLPANSTVTLLRWNYSESELDELGNSKLIKTSSSEPADDKPSHRATGLKQAKLGSYRHSSDAGTENKNQMLLACFTGFGHPSMVHSKLEGSKGNQPDSCSKLIDASKPQYSLTNLRIASDRAKLTKKNIPGTP